jgi:PTH1 family peptidyl-tRNA hydrolase
VRLKQGGGHGGHNGVRDIELHLGSADFWRLRIGIGHPRTLNLNQDVADFVLHEPRSEEKLAIDRALDAVIEELPVILEGKIPAAQRRLHGL